MSDSRQEAGPSGTGICLFTSIQGLGPGQEGQKGNVASIQSLPFVLAPRLSPRYWGR